MTADTPTARPTFTNLVTGETIDDELDPQALDVLAFAAAGGPAPSDLTDRRAGFNALFAQLSGEAEPVEAVWDTEFHGPHGTVKLRLYQPRRGRLPALVYTHGGGFNKGDLESHDSALRKLANHAGCVIIAVDYQRTPEAKYPVQTDEAFAALRWVEQKANELGVDASRLAVGGDSVGGNLAALSAIRARNEGGPRLAFQLLLYPVTDLTLSSDSWRAFADGPWLTKAEEHHGFRDLYLPEGVALNDPRVSPLFESNLSALPPALVADGEFDPYRDEGQMYAARLREAGVAVTATVYPGLIHDFLLMSGKIDASSRLIEQSASALRDAFEGAR